VIPDLVQIHPRTKQGRPVLFHLWTEEAPDISVPEMAGSLLPRLFPIPTLEEVREPIDICDHCAREQQ
jgi:hypothetical protein